MTKWLGVKLTIHPLFSMVMLGSVLTGAFAEILTLFIIVLVHELGHVAAIKWFGWRLREIQILPFGGVAVVDEVVPPAWQEAVVAAAGPFQNLWMAVVALLFHSLGLWGEEWTSYFIQANLMIALFNLLPIQPLDGGKLLHVFLCLWLPYHKALFSTTLASLTMSVMLLGFSILTLTAFGLQLNLLVIACFLIYSNAYTLKHFHFRFVSFLIDRDARTSSRMSKGVHAKAIFVSPQLPLSEVVKLFMRDRYHLIYVMNEQGKIQAILPEQKVVRAFFTSVNSAFNGPRITIFS
ncbi:site-2 protease family protein [Marinicrinis lubricantis]|uniref:Site-2 protease family protein n=1 Tax=Marinicrinis lubricantis TaxID=2086470 RepID=A0ABW1ITL6_9BACL